MGPTASPRERGRGRDRGGRTEERTLSVSHIYITHVRALHPTVFPSFFSDGRLPWALGASAFATVYRGPSYRHRPHYPVEEKDIRRSATVTLVCFKETDAPHRAAPLLGRTAHHGHRFIVTQAP